MSIRSYAAINITPLFLRLALGVVFIWAGWSKIAYHDPVVGNDAAVLANLGVISAPRSPATPNQSQASPPTSDSPSSTPAPSTPTPAPDDSKPAGTPEPASEPEKKEPPTQDPPSEKDPEQPPADPPPEKKDDPAKKPGLSVVAPPMVAISPPVAGSAQTTPPLAPAYVAENFPEPVQVRRLNSIALLLHKSAYPEDPARTLWPPRLSSPQLIRVLAWIAALTELIGGTLVLFGFLTRLSALGLAGCMLNALLLTTVGPAAVSGSGFLGFLPHPRLSESAAWVSAWSTMLFQFVLLMASLGIALSGPGAASIDRLVFTASKTTRKPATP